MSLFLAVLRTRRTPWRFPTLGPDQQTRVLGDTGYRRHHAFRSWARLEIYHIFSINVLEVFRKDHSETWAIGFGIICSKHGDDATLPDMDQVSCFSQSQSQRTLAFLRSAFYAHKASFTWQRYASNHVSAFTGRAQTTLQCSHCSEER